MSFSTPVLDITGKQRFSDTDGNTFELRLHDNSLFICKVNADGTITQGGEIILDPLPDDVLYGSQGASTNEAVAGSATFDTTVEAFTSAEDEFIATMNESTGGSTEVISVSSGSAIVEFEVFFDSSSSALADSLVTTLSTDAGLSGLLTPSATFSSIPTTVTAGFTPSKSIKKAKSAITKATYADGQITVHTVGSFDKIEYDVGAGFVSTSSSVFPHTPAGAVINIILKLLNPEGTLLGTAKTFALDVIIPPLFEWAFEDNSSLSSHPNTGSLGPIMPLEFLTYASKGAFVTGKVGDYALSVNHRNSALSGGHSDAMTTGWVDLNSSNVQLHDSLQSNGGMSLSVWWKQSSDWFTAAKTTPEGDSPGMEAGYIFTILMRYASDIPDQAHSMVGLGINHSGNYNGRHEDLYSVQWGPSGTHRFQLPQATAVDEWVHWAAVIRDYESVKVWHNGTLVVDLDISIGGQINNGLNTTITSGNAARYASTSPNPNKIDSMHLSPGTYNKGELDQVQMYGYALSDAAVQTLYQEGS